jgi:hypothetical protein
MFLGLARTCFQIDPVDDLRRAGLKETMWRCWHGNEQACRTYVSDANRTADLYDSGLIAKKTGLYHLITRYVFEFDICTVRPRRINLSQCLTNEALRHGDLWGSGCTDPCFLDIGTRWR